MKVKELIEHLQSLDQNLDVYIYNEKESSLFSVETVYETSDFGWFEGWEDFVTIFPTTNPPFLFILTAEEVEYLKDDLEFKKLVKTEPLCNIEQKLLTRIKQYENKRT